MAAIDDYLRQIANAVYGEEVRGSIVSAISECYNDNGADKAEIIDIRTDVDGQISSSAGDAVRKYENEIKDARTDFHTTVHDTLGDAVRAQASELYNDNRAIRTELTDIRNGLSGRIWPTAGTAVRGEMKKIQQDVDTFRTSINTAIAEIKDARVGISGTKYGLLGDAIRGELTKFQKNMDKSKMTAPNDDGSNGQLLASNGDGTTKWVDVGLPTDEQVENAVYDYITDNPGILDILSGNRGWVTPEMYGAVGDGHTDDSEAVQEAVNSGFNVRFGPHTYCFANVNIYDNIVIEGCNATLKPLQLSTTSNQFDNMFTCTCCTVIFRNLNFVGLGPALTATNYTPSLIETDTCNVSLENCSFVNIYTKNQAVSGTLITERFSLILFAKGCDQFANIVNCRFSHLGGEEIITVVPDMTGPLVNVCRFENNQNTDNIGYSFNLYATHLLVRNNYIYNCYGQDRTRFAASLFNFFAVHALVEGNYITNVNAGDCFDFAESYSRMSIDEETNLFVTMLRGYSIRVRDNYVVMEGGKFLRCVGENVIIDNNYVEAMQLYEGINTNLADEEQSNIPEAMKTTSLLEPNLVNVSNNIFVYKSPAYEPFDQNAFVNARNSIRAVITFMDSGRYSSSVYTGRRMLQSAEAYGNLIIMPYDDTFYYNAYPTFSLDSLIRSCRIYGNTVVNPGKTLHLASNDSCFVIYPIAFDYTTDYIAINDNTIINDQERRLDFFVDYVGNPSSSSDYGFDVLNTAFANKIEIKENYYNYMNASGMINWFWNVPHADGTPIVNEALYPREMYFGLTAIEPTSETGDVWFGRGVYDISTNTVRLYFLVRTNTVRTDNTALFTVPAAYRPPVNKSYLYGCWQGTGVVVFPVRVGVETDGTVRSADSNSVKYFSGTIEYSLNSKDLDYR